MKKYNRRRLRLIIPIFGLIFIIGGTYLAIQFAKGYRPSKTGIQGTGLLAANSFPPGAQVYINNKLTSATDDTIDLPPGEYDIAIKKEGYAPWEKHLKIQEELVTQTNATLFRAVPSLTPLTLSGAVNIRPSPNGQKIAYAVASASAAAKNGLYVLELTSSPLSLQNSPKQIAKSSSIHDFSQADLLWSPNSTQILAHFQTKSGEVSNYLLNADSNNDLDTLTDVTARLSIILSEWEEDIVLRESKQFALLPDDLKAIATSSATDIYFSPNEERVLYTSTGYTNLPENLITPPPATNTQPEERDLQQGNIYIYDLIEDKNFRIGSINNLDSIPHKALLLLKDYQQPTASASALTPTPANLAVTTYNHLQDPKSIFTTFANFRLHYSSIYALPYQWYPDSSHIIITKPDQAVDVVEYDGTNTVTVYAGPFANSFSYPWPDGSKLIILTNLNPATELPLNLYAVDIR